MFGMSQTERRLAVRYTIEEQRLTFQIYGMILGTIILPLLGNSFFDFPADGELTGKMVWYQVNIGTWDGGDILFCVFIK